MGRFRLFEWVGARGANGMWKRGKGDKKSSELVGVRKEGEKGGGKEGKRGPRDASGQAIITPECWLLISRVSARNLWLGNELLCISLRFDNLVIRVAA